MTTAVTAPTRTGSLLKAGVAAVLVASCATTTVAAAGSAAGVSLDVNGAPIPVIGFATLTAIFSLVGLALSGTWVFGGGLLPPESATVVRVAGGTTTLTDGPFAETKEQLGGFWVIRADDLDEALKWAEKCAEACQETIEVRPFQDEPEA